MYLLEVSVVNSFVCYRDCRRDTFNSDAKSVLATQLLAHCYTMNTPLVPHQEDEFSTLMQQMELPPPNLPLDRVLEIRQQSALGHFQGDSVGTRVSCFLHPTRLPTYTYCRTCGVFLHRQYCFFLFHHCNDLLQLIDSAAFQSLSHH